jgi:uncharacterized phage protein (TIGR02220 family)
VAVDRYSKVSNRLWRDARFRALSKPQRLLWLYLLTGTNTNQIGLYSLPLGLVVEDMGDKPAAIRRDLDAIAASRMIYYDADERLVWIPRWLDYNSPNGDNVRKSFLETAHSFAPHRFAAAFEIMLAIDAANAGAPVTGLNAKQAVGIRDDLACLYCAKPFERFGDFEIDRVDPSTKDEHKLAFDLVVAACKKCNAEKGRKTAEEFGHPFVHGEPYSVAAAFEKLAYDAALRTRFVAVYNGLPRALSKLADPSVASIFDELSETSNAVKTALERRPDGDPTGDRTQKHKQKQKQKHNEEEMSRASALLSFLNEKTRKNFEALDKKGQPTESLKFFLARIDDGASDETIRAVIIRKTKEWDNSEKMRTYLRPATLLSKKNFEQYVGEIPKR